MPLPVRNENECALMFVRKSSRHSDSKEGFNAPQGTWEVLRNSDQASLKIKDDTDCSSSVASTEPPPDSSYAEHDVSVSFITDGEDSDSGTEQRDDVTRQAALGIEKKQLRRGCYSRIGNSLRKSVHFSDDDSETTELETSSETESVVCDDDTIARGNGHSSSSFLWFRIYYIIVTVAIMLADGLQGTHLYVLYEGYGYSVASLYCLGFVIGAVTSPITGALVDKIGRKKAALLYCALEIFINWLEQYPILAGLIVSRMIGGITTNLLSSVFETWLDTEYRRRGFDKAKYEIVMRDSVVASNLAAIASGYLAHKLAERFGPVGPFEGAIACTAVAFAIVMAVWTENYGSDQPGLKSVSNYLTETVETFKADSMVLRVGIIQGLTMGSLQIFVFLWSPALRELAKGSVADTLGLDSHGEPAYGLIFGAFMAAGVLGGLIATFVRKGVTILLSPLAKSCSQTVTIEGEGEVRPMAVEFLAAFCYFVCAGLLLAPCLVAGDGMFSFSISLVAFLMYEFMVGVYLPCEGVIRSLYIPSDARCSMMTFPRIIANVAVSLGVISTRYVSLNTAFFAVSCLMGVSAILQLSLVSAREWASLFGRVDRWKKKAVRSLSFSSGFGDLEKRPPAFSRSQSMPTHGLLSQLEIAAMEVSKKRD